VPADANDRKDSGNATRCWTKRSFAEGDGEEEEEAEEAAERGEQVFTEEDRRRRERRRERTRMRSSSRRRRSAGEEGDGIEERGREGGKSRRAAISR